jgi:hypothetical protein
MRGIVPKQNIEKKQAMKLLLQGVCLCILDSIGINPQMPQIEQILKNRRANRQESAQSADKNTWFFLFLIKFISLDLLQKSI